MKLVHLGTFDVANYGDLLFPLVLDHRLSDLADELIHGSPVGGPPIWQGCRATISIDDVARVNDRLTAVVIGGGQIIDAEPTLVATYSSQPLQSLLSYPQLWLVGSQLAERSGIPLCWNAPGVSNSFRPGSSRLLAAVVDKCDYLAVRDETSERCIQNLGTDCQVHQVPDTAFDVARLWTRKKCKEAYAEAFHRRGRQVADRTIAVHVSQRFITESPAEVAYQLDSIAQRTGSTITLLALGPCHGDDECVRQIAVAMRSNPLVVDDPASLVEFVGCISEATLYIGNSLHGAITAISFGGPAVLVDSPGGDSRLRDFTNAFQLTDCLASSWVQSGSCAERSFELPNRTWTAISDSVADRLDQHWTRLRDAIVSGKMERRHRARLWPATVSVASDDTFPLDHDAIQTILQDQALRVPVLLRENHRQRIQRRRLGFKLRRTRREFTTEVAQLKSLVKSVQSELAHVQQDLRSERDRQQKLATDCELLDMWLDTYTFGTHELAQSKRWRLGNALGRWWNRLLCRGAPLTAMDLLKDVGNRHRRWQSQQTDDRPAIDTIISSSSWSRAPMPILADGVTLPTADIVICVHNALDYVRPCLESVMRCTAQRHRIIVIDDGSDEACREYLASILPRLIAHHDRSIIVTIPSSIGYTKAANEGLRLSDADYTVLLNSDTVVSSGWLERILECGESDQRIGMVGPLSNAASWQSVPKRYEHGDWAKNALPDGWTVDEMATFVDETSARAFPRVPLVNGFCIALKRAVPRAIGYFDDKKFSSGYGEENDYCFRAANAGFELAIADHAYVFHHKSQSYGDVRRRQLSRAAHRVLEKRYSSRFVSRCIDEMKQQPILEAARDVLSVPIRAANATHYGVKTAPESTEKVSLLFLLPVASCAGGTHCVVDEAMGLNWLGARTRVAIRAEYAPAFRFEYPTADRDRIFVNYRSDEELIDLAGRFDIVIGTIYHSMQLVRDIVSRNPSVLPAYYVQDYEPLFFAGGSDKQARALASYALVPEAVLFAKTDWLCETIRKEHGVDVHRVVPSVNHQLFRPAPETLGNHIHEETVRLLAMVRPSTPRRAAGQTMAVLKQLKHEFDYRISIDVFGASEDEIAENRLPRDFDYRCHGRVSRTQVASLYRKADIFLDFSVHQAFGLSAVEAMASGCAVVVPQRGGALQYARDRHNSIVVDTECARSCFESASELVRDQSLRESLGRVAMQTTSRFSIPAAARSEYKLLASALKSRRETESRPNGDPGTYHAGLSKSIKPFNDVFDRNAIPQPSSSDDRHSKHQDPLFCLICGHARSGTTVLSALVRQHPQIDGRFECGFLLADRPADFANCGPFPDLLMRGWNLTKADLGYICNATNWPDAYRRLRERSEIADKHARLFDKAPRYMACLRDVLAKTGAPCLVIVKDPREIYWANKKRGERRAQSTKQFCTYYLEYANEFLAARERYAGRLLLVRYEELCSNPAMIAKRVYDFLKIEFRDEYLRFPDQLETPVYAHGGLTDRFLQQYRGYLTPNEESDILDRTKKFDFWHWHSPEVAW